MEPAQLLKHRPGLTLRCLIVAHRASIGGLTIRTALLLGFGLTFGVWLFAPSVFTEARGLMDLFVEENWPARNTPSPLRQRSPRWGQKPKTCRQLCHRCEAICHLPARIRGPAM
jgi:hypothetical protein